MPNPADIALRKAAAGEWLSEDDAYALCHLDGESLEDLCAAASALRDRFHPRTLTYSPKVFLPITNLCRDRCSYCTFRRDPGSAGEWTMSPAEISDWARRGSASGCVEALMCLGDRPEVAFRGFYDLLKRYGVETTAEYVVRACGIALQEGLLPHTNAGLLSSGEMAALRPVNASMGLMLENISPRLRDRGMPHHHAPDKDPGRRLRMLVEAGELSIPFTTGILVGIGENEAERIASLLAIRGVHARYGHIQEVIVQNFRAKADTAMADAYEVDDDTMVRTLAIARLVLGGKINLQAPPNLSPAAHRRFIRAGINDWGGISPLTMDYVNPDAPWPHLEKLRQSCAEEGFELLPRLPVYAEYINERWVDPAMMTVLERFEDTARGAVAV